MIPEQPFSVGVLAANIFKGASTLDQTICSIAPGNTKIRQANLADFRSFRVLPPPCFRSDTLASTAAERRAQQIMTDPAVAQLNKKAGALIEAKID